MAHPEHVLSSPAIRVPSAGQAVGSHERVQASSPVVHEARLSDEDLDALFLGAHQKKPNSDRSGHVPVPVAPDSGAHQKKSDTANPDEAFNESFAVFQGGLSDWTIAGLNLSLEGRQARQWYRQFVDDGLIPAQWKGVELQLPAHVRITFEPGAKKVLGHYHRGRAIRDGTRFNINLNPIAHLELQRSAMQLAQVLLHEALHLCQDLYRQKVGKKAPSSGYHSVEFRRHAQELGIPCSAGGHDLGIVAGSRFAQWAERQAVSGSPGDRIASAPSTTPARKPPKRIAWRCQCPDAVLVMVPRASVIDVVCRRCDKPLMPKDSANLSSPSSASDNILIQEGTP